MMSRKLGMMVKGFTLLAAATSLGCLAVRPKEPGGPPAEAASPPKANGEYRGKVFLGLDVKSEELPKDRRYQSTYGLRINRVATESSAEKAGLRVGDVIVSMDGSIWKVPEIRLSYSYGKDGRKYEPGEVVRFEVLQAAEKDAKKAENDAKTAEKDAKTAENDAKMAKKDAKTAEKDAKKAGKDAGKRELKAVDVLLLPYPGTTAESPHSPTNEEIRPDMKDLTPDYQTLCWNLIRASGYEPDCQDLLLRLRKSEEFPDPHRLAVCRYVHRDPFKLEPVSRELVAPLLRAPASGAEDVQAVLGVGEHVLVRFGPSGGPAETPVAELPDFRKADLAGHLKYVEAVLKAAAEAHAEAFKGLSGDEAKFILDNRQGLLDSYIEFRMLSYDSKTERQKASVKLLDLARKVDVGALLRQARLVSLLVAPGFVDSVAAAAKASGMNLDSAVLAQIGTPLGAIVVGGRERNRYEGEHAAIYDLGGDDVYANNVASSVWGKIPSAVVVDYGGDDAYESSGPFRVACGDFGIGILVDLDGYDSYVGTRFAGGCGFLGVGLLLDRRGNDIYRAIECSQGVGHWGLGALVDSDGDDRYESHDTSQGVGLPGGCGIVWDRGNGRDGYYCKGKEPTGYGDSPGVFEGWGQAMGVGYRPYASGGVGTILDAGGSDRFEAGNFCQGGGYFYGFGVLYGAGADADVYIGSRYAQGFGCHQAAGSFIEEGGNDRYQTRQFVAQGLAWDEAVALFYDQSGDDRYEGGGFSQCASAMNGWTLFIEGGGTDTYLYTDQAAAGGNSYHGGTSLSFFLDIGGQQDRYPSKPNNAVVTGGERSIFADLPGAVQDALKADSWKALLPKEKAKP